MRDGNTYAFPPPPPPAALVLSAEFTASSAFCSLAASLSATSALACDSIAFRSASAVDAFAASSWASLWSLVGE